MTLLRRDTVCWNRRIAGTPDDLGNPTFTQAEGFPKTVRGHFNHQGADANPTEAGLDNSISAILFSQFPGGRNGDIVTKDGVDYIVDSTEVNRGATGKIDHYRYTMSKSTIGTAEDGV